MVLAGFRVRVQPGFAAILGLQAVPFLFFGRGGGGVVPRLPGKLVACSGLVLGVWGFGALRCWCAAAAQP